MFDTMKEKEYGVLNTVCVYFTLSFVFGVEQISVCHDLAKFDHFGTLLQDLATFEGLVSVWKTKIWKLRWQIQMLWSIFSCLQWPNIGQTSCVVNDARFTRRSFPDSTTGGIANMP